MSSFSWVRWLRSALPQPRKALKKAPQKLLLERLEDRLAPADATWTGGAGAANPQWSNAANWQGGIRPTGALDNLFFPNVANKTSVNDLAAGAQINSITFSSGGYTLSGNTISL